MATPRSRVVFVGNIPYEMSEEQLITIFSEVGPVAGFRLVFDRDTGKPKGYGFCEFHDPETAASAVRNLNDVDVGGRSLRIDWADVDPVFQGRTTQMGQIDGELPKRDGRRPGNPSAGGPQRGGGGAGAGPPFGQQGGPGGFGGPPQQGGFGGPGGYGGPPQGGFGAPPQGGFGGGPAGMDAPYNLNNLPPGVNLQAGQTATDAITQTLATLPPDQLLDIMGQIKSLILTSPQSAQNLLSSHPQLTYALFQAMLMMNLVDPAILQRILLAGGVNGGAAAAAVANGGPAANGAAGGMGQQQRYPSMGGGPPPPQQQQPYGGGAYGANPYSNTPPPGAPPSRPPFGQPSHLGRASSAQSTPPPPPPSAPPIAPPQANAAAAAAAAVAAGGGGAAAAANNPNLPDAQRQLLMQVLGLSDAQVAALPPDQRESIMMLRRQMGK